MNISEEIEELWETFDEGHKYSNDSMLIEKILHLLFFCESAYNKDLAMYRQFLALMNGGGLLIKEEKRFLINYFILLVDAMAMPTADSGILEQLRDCTCILDVWPQKKGVRADYATGKYRKEALVWLIRKYEVLGNHFLRKRGNIGSYSNMELAMRLKTEKCKLREKDYPVLEHFFQSSASFLKCEDITLSDLENGVKVMRKLIWQIKEGITKYS